MTETGACSTGKTGVSGGEQVAAVHVTAVVEPRPAFAGGAGGRCFYCGQPIPEDVASIEHLVPRSAGGGRVDNLVVCCRSINAFFGDAPLPLKLSAISDPDFIRALSRWCLVVGRLR